jgi:type IV secretion system protein VirB4
MLGAQHLRSITILVFPAPASPACSMRSTIRIAYRWVTRFIALDKTEATKALTKLRRQWFNKRKSVTAMLREVMYNQPAS